MSQNLYATAATDWPLVKWWVKTEDIASRRLYEMPVVFEVSRMRQKSKLLVLSEYVNKTEKVGGMWTNKNSYRENEVLSDILRRNCFMFKYSVTKEWKEAFMPNSRSNSLNRFGRITTCDTDALA